MGAGHNYCFITPPFCVITLATELASLGYPGFAYLKSRGKKNPAEVLLSALSSNHLEARLVEALPWILLKYPNPILIGGH
jgi:hypothetical protein